MTKQEFLDRLRRSLAGLPLEDAEERLAFYDEMIDDRMEEGLAEEEAVSSFGTPEEIAFYFRILMQEIRSFEALDSLYTVSTVFFGGGLS